MEINGKEYNLVWDENFSGDSLQKNWTRLQWKPRRVNKEVQYYTAQEENCYVSDNTLKIVALRKGLFKWTSARITTAGHKTFKYGYFEMSAKLPSGLGVWPAFWMMPEKHAYGPWPCSGEIDIMEYSPCTHGYNFFTTLHTGPKPFTQKHNIFTLIEAPTAENACDSFHKYGLLWTEDEITAYYDGKPLGRIYQKSQDIAVWPFNQEFHIILNLAMGGTLGGRIPSKLKKAVYEIEYVRVYQ